MDVSELSSTAKSKAGEVMYLRHPKTNQILTHAEDKKKPKKMYLKLLGPESPEMRKLFAEMNARNKNGDQDFEKSEAEMAAELEADCRMLSDLTIGGEVFFKGKWLDVEKEGTYDLYHTVLAFRSQALKFFTDPGNFIAG